MEKGGPDDREKQRDRMYADLCRLVAEIPKACNFIEYLLFKPFVLVAYGGFDEKDVPVYRALYASLPSFEARLSAMDTLIRERFFAHPEIVQDWGTLGVAIKPLARLRSEIVDMAPHIVSADPVSVRLMPARWRVGSDPVNYGYSADQLHERMSAILGVPNEEHSYVESHRKNIHERLLQFGERLDRFMSAAVN